MAFSEDLAQRVAEILKANWDERGGRVVPEPANLSLGNEAVAFDRATVLYADLTGSTAMVDSKKWWFAAEVYKAYLHCAASLIRAEGGVITSYDGDRVMGIWVDALQSVPAARCGLKITYAVREILNPALRTQYPGDGYDVRHVVGIDTSSIHVARTGVRGENDLVWIGRAANYAAKLSALDLAERVWITKDVFDRLDDATKYGGASRELMWKEYSWSQQGNHAIYGSSWQWKP